MNTLIEHDISGHRHWINRPQIETNSDLIHNIMQNGLRHASGSVQLHPIITGDGLGNFLDRATLKMLFVCVIFIPKVKNL